MAGMTELTMIGGWAGFGMARATIIAASLMPIAAGAAAQDVAMTFDAVSCPLLSGPSTMTVWIKEGTTNASEEAQAGGDYRQAA